MNQNEMSEFFQDTMSILHLDERNEPRLSIEYDNTDGSLFYALTAKIPGEKRSRTVRAYGTTPEMARDTLKFTLTRTHNWTGNPENDSE